MTATRRAQLSKIGPMIVIVAANAIALFIGYTDITANVASWKTTVDLRLAHIEMTVARHELKPAHGEVATILAVLATTQKTMSADIREIKKYINIQRSNP